MGNIAPVIIEMTLDRSILTDEIEATARTFGDLVEAGGGSFTFERLHDSTVKMTAKIYPAKSPTR